MPIIASTPASACPTVGELRVEGSTGRHETSFWVQLLMTILASGFLVLRSLAEEISGSEASPETDEEMILEALDVATLNEEGIDQRAEAGRLEAEARAVDLDPKRKRWKFELRLAGRSYFDSNIFIEPRHEHADWVSQLEPSVCLGLGDYLHRAENYLALAYAGRATWFAVNSGQNSLDHDVHLNALKQFSQLDVQLGLHFQTATEPNIDAGRRTESRLAEGSLKFRYAVTARSAIEADTIIRKQEDTGLLGSTDLRLTNWFVYQATARLDQSLGVAVGELQVSRGSNQTYTQFLSRTRLMETAKLTAALHLGLELRQYAESGRSKVNPVFALDLDYDSHRGRFLHLEAFRKTESSSLYADENRIATGCEATLRQHMAAHWSAALGAGAAISDYVPTGDSTGTERRDQIFSLSPSLTYEVAEHWSATLFARARRVDSTQDRFSFTDLQAGIGFGASF